MTEEKAAAPRFVKCRFPTGSRVYTYSSGGLIVKPGDRVKVDTRDGFATVEVVGTTDEAPPFEVKPIREIIAPEEGKEERKNHAV